MGSRMACAGRSMGGEYQCSGVGWDRGVESISRPSISQPHTIIMTQSFGLGT